jgi:transposase-like protein
MPADIAAVGGSGEGEMRHTELAAKLGIHPRTLRRQFARGGLPGAVEHGERILMVPTRLLRLARAYGLRGVERMANAGLL